MNTLKGLIYGEDFQFHRGVIEVGDGCFSRVELLEGVVSPKELEPGENYLIPGLTDIHFHGFAGYDFSGGSYEELKGIAKGLAANGITSFAVASVTQPEEMMEKAYRNAARLAAEQPAGSARILGINMEGPFFSKEKKGAQAEEYLKLPDLEMVSRLAEAAEGLLKIVCVAPELPGAMEFIEKASKAYTVSLAHTVADYDISKEAIHKGARQVTHLFNAMPPLLHRQPGLIGAAVEDERVMAELISDGVHVHESAVRAAFRLFSAERIILISDCLSACQAQEGQLYWSGSTPIHLKNGRAVLEDEITLAGSVSSLFECMGRAMSFGIKPEDAIRAASFNGAAAIGETDKAGTIAASKPADFLICGEGFRLIQAFVGGIPAGGGK